MRPQYPWEDVVRILNQANGARWTIERFGAPFEEQSASGSPTRNCWKGRLVGRPRIV